METKKCRVYVKKVEIIVEDATALKKSVATVLWTMYHPYLLHD